MKTQSDHITQEEIGRRAYSHWESAGRPFGRDMEFWLKAEEEILAGKKKPVQPKPGAVRSAPDNVVPLKTEKPNIPASQIPSGRQNKPALQTRKA